MTAIKSLRHLVTVEPVSFLFFTSLFLQNGGGQQFIFYKLCYLEYNLTDVCWNLTLGQKMDQYQDIEDYTISATAHWMIYMNLPLTIPAIFTTICFGGWSDKYGRKPMMIIPAVGFLIMSIFQMFQVLRMDMPLGITLIGNFIAGMSGGFVTITFATFSYIADITTKENRTLRIGILQSMTFSSSIVGLLTSGVIVQNREYGFLLLYCLIALLNILIVVYTQFWLLESIGPNTDPYFQTIRTTEEKETETTSRPSEVSEIECKTCFSDMWSPRNFKIVYRDVMKKRQHFDRFILFLLFVSLFILQMVLAGDNQMFALYAKDSFHLSPAQTGYFTASKNAVLFLFTVLGVWLLRKFNLNEMRCCSLSFIVFLSGYIGFSLAKSESTLWAMLILLSPSGLVGGIIRGAISRTVGPDEQGSIFAAMSSMENLMVFVAAFMFNILYPVTKDILNGGFVYFVMAELLIIPLILTMWVGDLLKYTAAYKYMNEPANIVINPDL
ncbi:proton-coupled folate transporter-like [Antedon mediterranea]|uniref:proton-coupled folate transporter-like n=1 Tax=Antedon mediterranea TaxID=105859 RepID=UPI003AF643CF